MMFRRAIVNAAYTASRHSNISLFNTTQARIFMPMQMRLIHQRGYTNFDDNYSFIFNEINFALNNAKNTDNIVFVYKKYG